MTVRTALTAVALTVLAGLGLLGGGGPSVVDSTEPASLGLAGEQVARFEHHRCSTTGFDETETPTEAIIRYPNGRTRVVSFDRGWASFTETAPGELIAVCLGQE